MRRFPRLFIASALPCVLACADDGDVAVVVEEATFSPAEIAVGQTTMLRWKYRHEAHIRGLRWLSIFQGDVDENSGDGPDALTSVTSGEQEGSFACTLGPSLKLGCAGAGDDAAYFDTGALSPGENVFTVRACGQGIDGSAEANSDTACDYQAVRLTIR